MSSINARHPGMAANRLRMHVMWQDVFTAFALYMIIEGMIPFIGPDFFRRAVARIAEMNDNHLRATGLTVMVAGLVLLFIVR